MASTDEIRDAVDLQKIVWDPDDRDLVPVTEIVAASHNGGIVLGAFEGARLVGFCFSMVGRRGGVCFQYSRMLAVHPEFRSHGLGAALKLEQKRVALAMGDTRMEWTFDPLEARNAALNLRRLGARVRHYYRDFYGLRSSRFDLGVPTDRFRAEWDLTEEFAATSPVRRAAGAGAPATFEVAMADGRIRPRAVTVEPAWTRCLIPVPHDFQWIRENDHDNAILWRQSVRQAAETAFALGMQIVDFEPHTIWPGCGAHVLIREG